MATSVAALERLEPGIGTSFGQQAWLLGVSGRWVYLTLGLLTVLMLVGLAAVPPDAPETFITALFAVPFGAFWAVMVWQGEGPSRRTYHWSLPVPRPAHDLARVTGGALYLLGAYAVLAGTGALAASAQGTWGRFAAIGPEAWASFFVAPLIVYLLTTSLVLWSEYAVTRWVIGTVTGFSLLAAILASWGYSMLAEVIQRLLFGDSLGFDAALFTGTLREVFGSPERAGTAPSDPWWPAAALWLAVGLALTVFTAAYRPDDVTRLVRSAARRGAPARAGRS
ncbi:MAG: hypothetical protein HY703_09695 [Gemmatimonadetes bacterium]|nr:hypothetical protein [Gemmatimonadota bacterium]